MGQCTTKDVPNIVTIFSAPEHSFFLLRRYIKLSSPKLNNVAVIGCILVYVAVILLGFDDATLSVTYFPAMCTVSTNNSKYEYSRC